MSVLVDRFAQRVHGTLLKNADEAILGRIRNLRQHVKRKNGAAPPLEIFFPARKIKYVVTNRDLNADGALIPLGDNFHDGFQMALRPDLPSTRIRFTVAHELCHTFFYEEVPEIKFTNHPCDEGEERLCNVGAAELLMPETDVKRQAKGKAVSLATLEELANHYGVSWEAMFVRLRSAKIWNAELSVWRKITKGTFELKRILGAKNEQWRWLEEDIPNRILTGHVNALHGSTFWIHDTLKGPRFKPVHYEARRRRDEIIALGIMQKRNAAKPVSLFHSDRSSLP